MYPDILFMQTVGRTKKSAYFCFWISKKGIRVHQASAHKSLVGTSTPYCINYTLTTESLHRTEPAR